MFWGYCLSGLDCSEQLLASSHQRWDILKSIGFPHLLQYVDRQVPAVKPGSVCSTCPSFHSLKRHSKSSVGLDELAVLLNYVYGYALCTCMGVSSWGSPVLHYVFWHQTTWLCDFLWSQGSNTMVQLGSQRRNLPGRFSDLALVCISPHLYQGVHLTGHSCPESWLSCKPSDSTA